MTAQQHSNTVANVKQGYFLYIPVKYTSIYGPISVVFFCITLPFIHFANVECTVIAAGDTGGAIHLVRWKQDETGQFLWEVAGSLTVC